MSCYYCWEEGLTIADHANCPYCRRDVCTPPSSRWDGDFHGEVCGCGCDVVVCERHLRVHAQTAHGRTDPADCFPALWTLVSRSGLGGAAALLAGGRPADTRAVTRFLNVAVPTEGLATLAAELPDRYAVFRGEAAVPYVEFGADFYVAGTAERTLALAAREVERGVRALRRHPDRAAWVTQALRAQREEDRGGAFHRELSRLRSHVDRITGRHLPADGVVWRGGDLDVGEGAMVREIVGRYGDVEGIEADALAAWVAAPLVEKRREVVFDAW
jgi:hypothetical protein